MVMSLNLGYWESYALTAGCNIYTSKFYLCVQNVRSVAEQQLEQTYLNSGGSDISNNHSTSSSRIGQLVPKKSTAMYFHEPETSLVPTETFLATAVPKILISTLIIFLNVVAIITLVRSNRTRRKTPTSSSTSSSSNYFILPSSTQGLLHSLFTNYLLFGLVNLYSQISLSVFLLGDNIRIVDDQGKECLVVNCLLITFSTSIALHLISLAVDRTLASYLSYKKYTLMSAGTVPLWLLSIWLPSIILGVLPLAGWRKTNFTFCVFIYQFNDDYLKFVAIFFLTCICAIPCLYLYFLLFLKSRSASFANENGGNYNTYNSNNFKTNSIEPKHLQQQQQQPRVVVYRWYRKLQAHHRLTFTLILTINILCWTPFHIYLLLACQSCPYSELSADGYILEYIFMATLIPSLLIPLLFSLRSSFMEKCASKLTRCVTFKSYSERRNKNPLGYKTNSILSISCPPYHSSGLQRSSLFFIDDFHHGSSGGGGGSNNGAYYSSTSNASLDSSSGPTTSRTLTNNTSATSASANTSCSNIILKSDKETNNNTFFVPHYLPTTTTTTSEQFQLSIQDELLPQEQENNRRHNRHHHQQQRKTSSRSRHHQADQSTMMTKGGITVPAQVHHYHSHSHDYDTANGSFSVDPTLRRKKKKSKAPSPHGGGSITNKYKSSFKNSYDTYYSQNKTLPLKKKAVPAPATTTATGCYGVNESQSNNLTTLIMSNDCCGNIKRRSGSDNIGSSSEYFHNNNNDPLNHTYNSLESDMKYGFPILPPPTSNSNSNSKSKSKTIVEGNNNMNLLQQYNNNAKSNLNYRLEKRHGIYYNSDDDESNDYVDGVRRQPPSAAIAAVIRNNNVMDVNGRKWQTRLIN